ncbi:MAG: putative tankyrase type protein [Pseudomonadota bacterium]|jgi:tankyrase
MKHPLLEGLAEDYPFYLEQHFDHVLKKIDVLWDTPQIDDYISELLIDKRGGRKGFPPEATKEIEILREFRMLETFRAAERKDTAIRELGQRGIFLKQANFLRAVEDGDLETVDLFVRANFNIHITDENGTPPLLIALKKGYTIIARILLTAGADVNDKDKIGLTPLMVACGKSTAGYREIAETLIKKGAQVNVRDALGFTPLLLALSGGTIEIAEMLINKGADITVRTRKGETPLSLAEKAQCHEIVALLLSKRNTHHTASDLKMN